MNNQYVSFSINDFISKDGNFCLAPFFREGKPVKGPVCGLTLLKAHSMRFRWNEQNSNRAVVFSRFGIKAENLVQLELIHSQKVFPVESSPDTLEKQGDGIISCNPTLTLTVTVADCMPIYLYDPVSGCFGLLHSGWKGTGIVLEALKIAQETFGARTGDFSVVMGAHIGSCCYKVDQERAKYFAENFSPSSVRETSENGHRQFFVSLAQANLFLLESAGIKSENIALCSECTCCSSLLASYRRQGPESFTPMAAFARF